MRRDPADPSRVIVFAPNWLGDAVMALPAIGDVRRGFPSARLVVAARPAIAGLFHIVPGVDDVRALAWRGRPLDRHHWRMDVEKLRELAADLAILLPNSFASAWLAARARIPHRWGYAADLRGWLLSRAVPRPRASLHQGQYYQHLVRALGMESGPLEPRVVLTPAAIDDARRLLGLYGWNGVRPIVAVAPGAAYGTAKQWLPEHFAAVIAPLVRERGVTCVLVGSEADAPATKTVRGLVSEDVARDTIDLAGQTTIEMLAAMMSIASACVSNDSGAMHLAAAAGVPLVALFGPTNERETAPLGREDAQARVVTHDVPCRPCMLRHCPIDHRCMNGLEPDRVRQMLESMMRRPHHVAPPRAVGPTGVGR